MKLIIDIPEEVKAEIDAKHTNARIEMIAEEAIQNGIPLDDIWMEIASYKSDRLIDVERNEMVDIVLEIIDKHTK